MQFPKGNALFTSESVSEGHPDKVADRISDTVLDAFLAQDPNSLVACETLVTTGLVVLAGEIHSSKTPQFDIQDLVRKAIKDIGYTSELGNMGFDAESCGVLNSLHAQSGDIRQGVLQEDDVGAGDQGLMFGFACKESPQLMPLPIQLSHALVDRLAAHRKKKTVNWLRPDAKSQVTIEYKDGKPHRVHTIVLSTQHNEVVGQPEIHSFIKEVLIPEVIPANLMLKNEMPKIHVNPTGRFVIGGPHGDSGLTGRKIIVDTYGGYAPHGGGAFSGKDPTKVDRSAAYMARYIAKNLVAAGIMDKALVQLAYAIGVADPVSVLVDDYGTSRVDRTKLEAAIREIFPLKPAKLIAHLNLKRPIFAKTAAYGHFGRELPEFTWEKTDKVSELQAALK